MRILPTGYSHKCELARYTPDGGMWQGISEHPEGFPLASLAISYIKVEYSPLQEQRRMNNLCGLQFKFLIAFCFPARSVQDIFLEIL
jgi:hypothetical protein